MKPTLTVALLVSNAIETMPSWLNLAKNIADEIIVLDHDSSDGTWEYLQREHAIGSINELNNLPLQNLDRYGFAAAKNKLHELATKDWVMFLDSDEFITIEDAKNVSAQLEQPKEVGILTVRRHNLIAWPECDGIPIDRSNWENAHSHEPQWHVEPQHKVLRNVPEVRHAGIIHEEPGSKIHTFKFVDINIYHMNAMLTHEEQHKKHLLYMHLIKKCVDNPELHHGVNKWWYDGWYDANKDYVDQMSEEFERTDARFYRGNDS